MGNRSSAEAEAWLETMALDTVATLSGSPSDTIVPTARAPDTAGARALALLDELAADPRLAARLRLGAEIGQGGMGIIHEAEQVALGRTVAVKTLRPAQRERAAAFDLLREAWVTGSLEHPNIVPVHDLGLDSDGTPSIVLKRIGGVEWSRLVADAAEVERRFGVTDLLAWNLGILLQVLNAVRFAHSHKIIHRDLKPNNVMIGDFGEVYLLDWGIAVSLHDDGTGRLPLAVNAKYLAGTPCYMAPEMLGREGSPPLSERTDVYLAGAVLYELITGKPPHAGTNAHAVITSVITSQPELPAHVAPELARICTRAMHEDPAQRFESIEALRNVLQRYLEHRGSAQLAERARARLDQLLEQLDPSSSHARQEDIYRLFGACRYGFRDALAVWPENIDARDGLVRTVVAVAAYELAANRPQAAVSLLGELDDPPPLLETARAAVAAQSRRVAELERIGRDHDVSIGRRARSLMVLGLGLFFTVSPLVAAIAPSFARASYPLQTTWSVGFVVLIGIVGGWWARATLWAPLINRRLLAAAMFVFAMQAVLSAGCWVAGRPLNEMYALAVFLYGVIAGMIAINIDRWLWPASLGYAVAFLVGSHDAELALYAMSASNLVFTVNAVWRWGGGTTREAAEPPR
jgi:serine/threonine-protein kinase